MSADPIAAAVNAAATEEQATLVQMAALDFEPWTDMSWSPPTSAEWSRLDNPYGFTLRIASKTVQKTKPELVAMIGDMDDEVGGSLMNGFVDTITFFEGCLELLKCAETRILAAGAAAIVAGGEA